MLTESSLSAATLTRLYMVYKMNRLSFFLWHHDWFNASTCRRRRFIHTFLHIMEIITTILNISTVESTLNRNGFRSLMVWVTVKSNNIYGYASYQSRILITNNQLSDSFSGHLASSRGHGGRATPRNRSIDHNLEYHYSSIICRHAGLICRASHHTPQWRHRIDVISVCHIHFDRRRRLVGRRGKQRQ